jgi:hypothetical protein
MVGVRSALRESATHGNHHEPSLLLRLRRIVLEYFLDALLGLFLISRFGAGNVFDRRLAAIYQLLQFRIRHIQRENQNLSRMLGGKGRRVFEVASTNSCP